MSVLDRKKIGQKIKKTFLSLKIASEPAGDNVCGEHATIKRMIKLTRLPCCEKLVTFLTCARGDQNSVKMSRIRYNYHF